MDTVTEPKALQTLCLDLRARGRRIGLVPTMGYLHEGHLSLVDRARRDADVVVMSIFVNPAQFGPGEDLDAYPRDAERDAALAGERGVDVLFLPEPDAMYAPDHATWVDVPELGAGLCGASRPGHFRGVCTVVLKLFQLAQPHAAVFGEKDWQQLAIIRRMARDLDVPVEIIGQPIVREADGLAMSSRNVYLDAAQRAVAPHIRKGLLRLAEAARGGERDAAELLGDLVAYYSQAMPGCEPDYLSLVDPDDLTTLHLLDGPALCAVAVRLGATRLIDNLRFEV